MKILLTGCRGFLGSALAKHWRGKHELFLVQGRDGFAQAVSAAPACDWVVHCGFEVSFRRDPESVERNMASAGTVARFFAAARAKSLLFVSAAGAMGVSAEPVSRNESALGTTSPGFESYRDTAYIESKLRAEELFRSASIPFTVVYPTTVFGSGMPPDTLSSILGARVAPPGGTSYLALEDFLSAMDKLVERPPRGERYLLNGGNVLFRDLFSTARELANSDKKFLVLPSLLRPLVRISALLPESFLSPAILESAFGFKYYSAEKFGREFSWSPKLSLPDCLRAAMAGGRDA